MSLPIESLLLLLNISREGSVKRAAQRMGVSSSTAHRQLSHARTYYSDPLFKHAQGELLFTALGLNLISILELLEKSYLLAQTCGKLDPVQQRREVRIGLAACESSVMHSDLIELAMSFAPGIRLLSVRIHGERFESLRARCVDFLISTVQAAPDKEFHSLALAGERLLLVCGPQHPLAGTGVCPADEDIVRYPFIDVVEQSLDGHERLMRSTHFPQWRAAESARKIPLLAALGTSLAGSGLLMVLPERFARLLQKAGEAVILHTSSGPAKVARHLFWHQSMHSDPFMQWIRSVFYAAPVLER